MRNFQSRPAHSRKVKHSAHEQTSRRVCACRKVQRAVQGTPLHLPAARISFSRMIRSQIGPSWLAPGSSFPSCCRADALKLCCWNQQKTAVNRQLFLRKVFVEMPQPLLPRDGFTYFTRNQLVGTGVQCAMSLGPGGSIRCSAGGRHLTFGGADQLSRRRDSSWLMTWMLMRHVMQHGLRQGMLHLAALHAVRCDMLPSVASWVLYHFNSDDFFGLF